MLDTEEPTSCAMACADSRRLRPNRADTRFTIPISPARYACRKVSRNALTLAPLIPRLNFNIVGLFLALWLLTHCQSANDVLFPATFPSLYSAREGLATFPPLQTGRATFTATGCPVLTRHHVLSWFVLRRERLGLQGTPASNFSLPLTALSA